MSDLVILSDRRLPKKNQVKTTLRGPKTLQWNVLTSNSNTSIQQSTFNINMPSRRAGLSKTLIRHVIGSVVLTSTNASANSLSAASGDGQATCQFIFSLNTNPLSQDTLSTTVSLSSSGVTMSTSNVNYMQDECSFYKHDSKLDSTLYSGTSTMKNRFNNFLDATDPNSIFTSTSQHYTSDSSPFPNTSKITGITYHLNNTTPATSYIDSVTINFELFENVVSGLFENDSSLDSEFLYGQDLVSISITCAQNPLSFIKMTIPGAPFTLPTGVSASLSITKNELMYSIVCPQDYEKIPKYILYTNKNYITTISSCPIPGDGPYTTPVLGQTIASQVITLSTMPSMFIISVQNSNQSLILPKQYCPIRSITVNFGSYSAVLSSCYSKMLYQICYNNGLRVAFDQFFASSNGVIPAQNNETVYTNVTTNLGKNYLNSCPVGISITDINSDGLLMSELSTNSSIPVQFQVTFDSIIPSSYTDAAGFSNFAATQLSLVITTVYNELLTVDTESGICKLEGAYFTRKDVDSAQIIQQKSGGSFSDFLGVLSDTMSLNVPSLIDRIRGKKHGLGESENDFPDQKTSVGSGILKKESLKKSIWN